MNPFTNARESIGDVHSDLNTAQYWFWSLGEAGEQIMSYIYIANQALADAFELARQAEQRWELSQTGEQ